MEGWQGARVGAGFCYPHDIWAPSSFALAGTYDSYGRVEGIKEDSLEARMAMRCIRERIIELPAKEDGREAPAVVRSELTPFTLQDCIHEGRGAFKDYQGRVQPYGYVIVREDVYRALIRRGYSAPWRTPKRVTVSRYVRQGEMLVTALRAKMVEKAEETEPRKQMVSCFDLEGLEYEGRSQEYDFQHFLTHGGMEFQDHLGRHLVEMVEADSSDIPRFLRLIGEHLMFANHLSMLRRAWMPQPGAGSQDDGYETHAWLAELAQKICARELSRVD
jgi:hypothetical protein